MTLLLTAAGPVTTSVNTIRDEIYALALAQSPGLTANLPGSLIEDMLSTSTAAVSLIEQFKVETVNSISPLTANPYLLNQTGVLTGVMQGQQTNSTVEVVFSSAPGQVIPQGVIVTDGDYQYVTQAGTITGTSGKSDPVMCVATVYGTWAIPANSVNEIASSLDVPTTVTNPLPGIPATKEETIEQYRSRVDAAFMCMAMGMQQFLKTLLWNVQGVSRNLVSVRYSDFYKKWEVIVGGGDQYAVANAIFIGCGDTNALCGSAIQVLNITHANPGVFEVSIPPGYVVGQTVQVNGIVAPGPTELNGINYKIHQMVTPTSFILEDNSGTPVKTNSLDQWTAGGVFTPNSRNVVVSIKNYPDIYQIPFVRPVQQSCNMVVTWSTGQDLSVSSVIAQGLMANAIVSYINNLGIGNPINLIQLDNVTSDSLAPVMSPDLLTFLDFVIYVDGVAIPVTPGTDLVQGDIEGYYFMQTTNIVFQRN